MKEKLKQELLFTCSICMDYQIQGKPEKIRQHMREEHSEEEIMNEAMVKEL